MTTTTTNTSTPLLTRQGWAVFGGFAAMLIGLSFFDPHLAAVVGGGVLVIILLQHPSFFGVGGRNG